MTSHLEGSGRAAAQVPGPGDLPPRPGVETAAAPPGRPLERWQRSYAAAVRGVDGALLVLCTGAGTVLASDLTVAGPALSAGIATALLVTGALALVGAWEPRILGHGPEEFRRLGRGVLATGVVLAVAGLALQADALRLWVFGILPGYAVLALLCRLLLRHWLHRQRRQGRCMLPVLAVGSHDAVAELIGRTRRDPYLGWTVTGACTSTGAGLDGAPDIHGVPVVGDLEAVGGAVHRSGYRVVAVAPGPGWGPRRLHQLSWQLDGTHTELVVDPALMAAAGPRLHVSPVADLPLLRLSPPQLAAGRRLLKDVLDRVGAAVLLVVLAPLLLGAAIVVLADGGPLFRRQERFGADGRTFRAARFRTTRTGNNRRLTRAGRVLRRHCLDELPQLLAVLTGSMSLVGPRPTGPDDVAADNRRLLLGRPGMTGLWHVVPGHAGLSWEEAVRLDLYYLENWSVTLDLTILWKTFTGVLRRRA